MQNEWKQRRLCQENQLVCLTWLEWSVKNFGELHFPCMVFKRALSEEQRAYIALFEDEKDVSVEQISQKTGISPTTNVQWPPWRRGFDCSSRLLQNFIKGWHVGFWTDFCRYIFSQWSTDHQMQSPNLYILDMQDVFQKSTFQDLVIIMIADFNLPGVDWLDVRAACDSANNSLLIDIIQDNFFTQLVNEPTRECNILDLVLTTSPEFVRELAVGEPFSDRIPSPPK